MGEVQKVGRLSHLFLACRSEPWSVSLSTTCSRDCVRSTGPAQGGVLKDAGQIRGWRVDDEDGRANQRVGPRGVNNIEGSAPDEEGIIRRSASRQQPRIGAPFTHHQSMPARNRLSPSMRVGVKKAETGQMLQEIHRPQNKPARPASQHADARPAKYPPDNRAGPFGSRCSCGRVNRAACNPHRTRPQSNRRPPGRTGAVDYRLGLHMTRLRCNISSHRRWIERV